MAAAARFDSFHSTSLPERRALLTPRDTHVVWAALTGLVGLLAVALTLTTFQALDLRVEGLMSDLSSVTQARGANGFFTLPDAD